MLQWKTIKRQVLWQVVLVISLLTLVACGGGGGGSSDEFDSLEPLANPGGDQYVKTGDTVQLDGSGSTNPGGGLLTYSWDLEPPAESTATLLTPDSARSSFTADVEGNYYVYLTVFDAASGLASDPGKVIINATPPHINAPPVANAGSDQTVAIGDVVTLDGSGSSDADGDGLSYSWSFVERPEGSTAVLTGETTASPSFIADRAGQYELRLVVSDDELSSVADTIIVESSYIPLFTMAGDPQAEEKIFKSSDGVFYLASSEFYAEITNDSLVNFRITRAELFSGESVIGSTENTDFLGGEIFAPGETVGGSFILNANIEDRGFEFRYYLIRLDTSETFVVRYFYGN